MNIYVSFQPKKNHSCALSVFINFDKTLCASSLFTSSQLLYYCYTSIVNGLILTQDSDLFACFYTNQTVRPNMRCPQNLIFDVSVWYQPDVC